MCVLYTRRRQCQQYTSKVAVKPRVSFFFQNNHPFLPVDKIFYTLHPTGYNPSLGPMLHVEHF